MNSHLILKMKKNVEITIKCGKNHLFTIYFFFVLSVLTKN